jgi:hypothetical protein
MNDHNYLAETETVAVKLMVKLLERKKCSVHAFKIQTGIDLYKYRLGDTYPLSLTFHNYCDAQKLDPGWLRFLAIEVHNKILTETQALEILAKCPEHQSSVNTYYQMMLKEYCCKLQQQGNEAFNPMA